MPAVTESLSNSSSTGHEIEWHEGNDPGEAEATVYQPNNNSVNVIGHDRMAVNRLLIDTVAAVKAKRVTA